MHLEICSAGWVKVVDMVRAGARVSHQAREPNHPKRAVAPGKRQQSRTSVMYLFTQHGGMTITHVLLPFSDADDLA
jgi:hypothetical protein